MTVSRGKTANSLLWSAIENGSLAVISLGSLVVYSRLLSAPEFGLFSIVLATADLFGLLVTMLFHDALIQRPQVTARHFDTAFSVSVAVSLVLTAGFWLGAPLFGRLVPQPGAAQVFGWTGALFPCLAMSATIVAQQRRRLAFKSLAIRSLAGRALGGAAGVSAAFLGAGVWSLVLQQVVTASVGSAVLWLTCEPTPRLRFGWPEFRQLITFGMFSVGSLLLSFSIKRMFTIFAGLLLGVASVGYLSLGFRVVDVLWAILATAVSQVALPMLAGLQSDPARLRRAYRKSVEYACLLLYPCFAGIAVTAPEIVEIAFGRRWAPAVPTVAALACLVLLQAPRLFAVPTLTAVGRPRDSLVGVVAELGFMLAMVAAFGLPSLPWAVAVWLACECVQVPVSSWMLRRATGIRIADQFAGIRTPLLAALALALCVAAARAALPDGLGPLPRLVVLVAAGGAAYLAALCAADRALVATFLGFVRSGFAAAEPEPMSNAGPKP